MEPETTDLAPGAVIASRYRVDEARSADDGAPWFLGTDEQTDARIELHRLSPEDALAIKPLRGMEHQHVAAILDVVDESEGSVLVTEHVPGETLHSRLEAVGKKSPVDAVRTALRIADVLSHFHAAKGAHGSLRPASVVIGPEGRAAPVLTFVRHAGATPYHSPERGEAGGPSAADDSWAAAALVYHMLTGEAPPGAGLSSEEMQEAGVEDEGLRLAIEHGLSTDQSKRNETITTMKRELARWFVDHAGDEDDPLPPSAATAPSKPPPLPPSASPPTSVASPMSGVAASTKPPPAKSSRPLIIGLAVGALVFGVGGAWIFSAIRSKPEVKVVPVARPSEAPSAKEVDLAAVPVIGSKETSECIAALLPRETFKTTPDLDWVCKQPDVAAGAPKLRVEVVKGAAGAVTSASSIYAKLGWYDMAVYATVYAGCCADSKPLTAPKPAEGCDAMDKALRTLGIAVADGANYEAALGAFAGVVECESKANRAAAFKQRGPTLAREGEAFKEYVRAIHP